MDFLIINFIADKVAIHINEKIEIKKFCNYNVK